MDLTTSLVHEEVAVEDILYFLRFLGFHPEVNELLDNILVNLLDPAGWNRLLFKCGLYVVRKGFDNEIELIVLVRRFPFHRLRTCLCDSLTVDHNRRACLDLYTLLRYNPVLNHLEMELSHP